MPDVLSAEAIQERSGRGVEWETEVLFSELLRSHEQLRGERDDAQAMYRHERKFQLGQADELAAAVRAGGEAAEIADILWTYYLLTLPDDKHARVQAYFAAREALASLEPAGEKT